MLNKNETFSVRISSNMSIQNALCFKMINYYKNNNSFFNFLQENCKESKFMLPKKKPQDDTLKRDEVEKLMGFILDRDFYEINKVIRNKYKNHNSQKPSSFR